ncbi:MAG: type IV pilin protein [Piscinibacter sp.]|uniref:type IV pilin protein n=1 Tax=Piscinibacter sp. TaxID=1903157 RepID=UPI003D11BC0F
MNRPMTSRRGSRGFTLIEIVTVLGVAGVLSSIAWPSFQGSLQKARRAEAMMAMTQLQIAQERWYANRGRYGSLDELRLPAHTSAGHYQLLVSEADAQGYVAVALARGAQAGDAACRQLRLTVAGGTTTYASGPDASVANDAAANRRCWNF